MPTPLGNDLWSVVANSVARKAVGGLGYTATHMFYYPQHDTHVILNFHSHRRMQGSFQTHIRIAGLIKKHG